MRGAYVHGHHARENERLQDQAEALVELLDSDTEYPTGRGRIAALERSGGCSDRAARSR